jgi:zinc protease
MRSLLLPTAFLLAACASQKPTVVAPIAVPSTGSLREPPTSLLPEDTGDDPVVRAVAQAFSLEQPATRIGPSQKERLEAVASVARCRTLLNEHESQGIAFALYATEHAGIAYVHVATSQRTSPGGRCVLDALYNDPAARNVVRAGNVYGRLFTGLSAQGTGAQDAELMRRWMAEITPETALCMEAVGGDEPVEATLRFVLTRGGEVLHASVATTEDRPRSYGRCIARKALEWRLPLQITVETVLEVTFRDAPRPDRFAARREGRLRAPLELHAERFTLPCGMAVALIPMEHTSQVSLELRYNVGRRDDPTARPELSHLIEHLILRATREGGRPVRDGLDAITSSWNGLTAVDDTRYIVTAPSEHIERLLTLERALVAHPADALDEATMRTEREVVIAEHHQRVTERIMGELPYILSRELFPPGHPYRVEPTQPELVEAATVDDVRGFLRRWYVPSNAQLTLAGHLDVAVTRAMIERLFASVSAGQPVEERPVAPNVRLASATPVDVRIPALTGALIMTWLTPAFNTPGDAELDLVAAWINRHFRDRLVSEGISGGLYARQSSTDGVSTFWLTVTPGANVTTEALYQRVREELTSMRAGAISPESLGNLADEAGEWLSRESRSPESMSLSFWSVPTADDPAGLRMQYARYHRFTVDDILGAYDRFLSERTSRVFLVRQR